jgi:tryptophan synthase alpha chain
MMTRISRYQKTFAQLKAANQKAFIPFTLLGWHNPETSLEIIRGMVEGGATMLELGLAFSDPAADGPIIQAAAHETLESGFRVKDALALIRKIREQYPDIPIGLLVYYNMVLAPGIDRFFQQISDAGADGILIADLPPELAHEVVDSARKHDVDLIFIVSPLTSPQRLSQITQLAGGFLYIVSRLGITGTEERYDTQLQALLTMLRQQTDLPACVGFGISNPEQAANMIQLGADGVITGSRIIQMIRDNPNTAPRTLIRQFVETMAAALQ